ncbi:MAG: hypothetical protein J6O00_00665 [Clostridiales bacterium]|nr:hypothetical protein [Clostridiales bacterium]
MIGNRKSKLTAVVSTLLAGVFLMSACSVNMNGVGKAFSDLGEDLSEARSNRASARQEETQPAETEVAETSIEETETSETTEVTPEPTATPVPTATPTPSPTPVPQRVDFSDLTTDALTNDIDIKIEEFAESAHAEDDDDIVLAVFEGERVLIESEEDLASAVSVNLMLDAFYMEAEGIYNRVVNEQYAAYDLDPETVPPTKEVTVDYEYFFNGRLLCIVMNYSVTQEEEVLITSTEYYRFDLYTGQMIYSDMLVNDVDAFYDGLAEAVAESTSSRTDKAEDYHIEFFSIETNEDGETDVIAAVTADDGFEYYVVEVPDLYESLTRYGRIVCNVTYVEADEEVEEEEDIDEDADEDEDADAEEDDEEEAPDEEEVSETTDETSDEEDGEER